MSKDIETGLKKVELANAGSLTGFVPLNQQNINAVLDYVKWFLDNGYKAMGGTVEIVQDTISEFRMWISVYLLFQEKNWLEKLLGL